MKAFSCGRPLEYQLHLALLGPRKRDAFKVSERQKYGSDLRDSSLKDRTELSFSKGIEITEKHTEKLREIIRPFMPKKNF